jgi:hypothetical protein
MKDAWCLLLTNFSSTITSLSAASILSSSATSFSHPTDTTGNQEAPIDRFCLQRFATMALSMLEISFTVRAYRLLGNIAMVQFLTRLENCDDKNLLSGYLALTNGDKDSAQRFFLSSSNPIAALEMRCNSMDWEQALSLWIQLALERMPYVSYEYAQQLVIMGDYNKAIMHYKNSFVNVKRNEEGGKGVQTFILSVHFVIFVFSFNSCCYHFI